MVPTPSSLPGWGMSVAAILAYAVPALGIRHLTPAKARLALRCAWVLHGLALVFTLLNSPPHFGFAPALSITAWLMLTVYAVEQQLFPQMRARWVLAALGAVTVAMALVFPGHPLHVQASAWLPLHLALGIACYGLFAAAVVHAALMSQAEQRMRTGAESDSGMPLLLLERLTFRFVTAGFILLTATLLAGWLFGEQLYGHAWRWGHKEIFSLLSWLVFAVLLVGRGRFGWRGHHAVRMIYAGALLLLLGYVGSRFVLEVVLGRLQ
ncbi:MAG: cytochrome c biogenesis protein CcsA [Comamonas sp.]